MKITSSDIAAKKQEAAKVNSTIFRTSYRNKTIENTSRFVSNSMRRGIWNTAKQLRCQSLSVTD